MDETYLIGEEEYSLQFVEKQKKEGLREFIPYIEQIIDSKIKDFTWTCIENSPLYFWIIPAAVSEKRHPPFAHKVGGLKKHTMVAHYFANQFSKIFEINNLERDYVLSAIDLHDTCKRGIKHYNMRYFPIHHMLPRLRYDKYERKHLIKSENRDDFNTIMGLIENHMGSIKEGHVIKEKRKITDDMTLLQKIVYLSDYTSSRTRLDFEFLEGEF